MNDDEAIALFSKVCVNKHEFDAVAADPLGANAKLAAQIQKLESLATSHKTKDAIECVLVDMRAHSDLHGAMNDAGNKMGRETGKAVLFAKQRDSESVVFSLRGKNCLDVACKYPNSGGHADAAGFTLTAEQDKTWFPELYA